MITNSTRQTIRIAITDVSPPFVNPCVLKAQTFADIRKFCGGKLLAPGLNVVLFQMLLFAFAKKYDFTFVSVKTLSSVDLTYNYTFANDLADVSFSVALANADRVASYSLSLPVLYTRGGFVVSAKSYVTFNSELKIMPFDRLTIGLMIATWLTLILFETCILLRNRRPAALKSTARALGASLADFSVFSGLNNHALTKFIIGKPAVLCVALIWSGVIRYAYSSLITASLVLKVSPPFSNMNQLELRAKRGLSRAVVYPGFYKDFVQCGLHRELARSSLLVNRHINAMQMVKENPIYVYPETQLTAAILLAGQCQHYGFIEVPEMIELGYSFVFKKGSSYVEDFNLAIANFQRDLQARSQPLLDVLGFACPQQSIKPYRNKLSLKQVRTVCSIYLGMCVLGCMCLLLEGAVWRRLCRFHASVSHSSVQFTSADLLTF